MGTPAYRQNQRKNSGIYIGATRGRAIGRGKKRACLCVDRNTYSMECCGEGALYNQTIGQTQSPPVVKGAFSDGFSNGFDIGNI
jgi:hypothetical protein